LPPSATEADPRAQNLRGVVKRTRRLMTRGLIWVEVYRPMDMQAWKDFSAAVKAAGGIEAAAAKDPGLAERALTPIDWYGTGMLPGDLESFAHAYLVLSRQVDVQHDQRPTDSARIVQSFLNTDEIASPNYWPGAWVVVIEVDPGSALWSDIEAGKINAVSIMAFCRLVPVIADLEAT
jgi:hypothetical protein